MADEKSQEVQAWLAKADNDLRGAEVDLAADPPLVEDALFHCQQAAEKAMKAFLTAHDTTFRKTHDLDELASACEQIDASLRDALNPTRDLTVFAWEFRYPGSDEAPPEAEAHDSLILARSAVDAIRERLLKII
ncbi:MAG: HEPN domain-containing protein [Candidatus Eisenbacteria bacterium]|nr:HEPN domain-containing protein [Candidatus Eisenbacteria bacterium]